MYSFNPQSLTLTSCLSALFCPSQVIMFGIRWGQGTARGSLSVECESVERTLLPGSENVPHGDTRRLSGTSSACGSEATRRRAEFP